MKYLFFLTKVSNENFFGKSEGDMKVQFFYIKSRVVKLEDVFAEVVVEC